jgi:translocator protein
MEHVVAGSASRRKTLSSFLTFGMLAAAAAFAGVYLEPGQWYRELIKPDWAPLDWVFPFAASALSLAIAVAGWRVWLRGGISLSLVLWFAQLALNAAWSWLFFGLHLPLLAFVDAVLLLLVVVAFSLTALNPDRIASLLFVPYALWSGFAAMLNYSIWRLNLGLI